MSEKCACCGEDAGEEFYLHSRCHIEAPVWIRYNPEKGMLRVECAACRQTVAVIPCGPLELDSTNKENQKSQNHEN